MKIFILFILLFIVTSCSTVQKILPEDYFVINCSQSDCLVVTGRSEILGITPLRLQAKMLNKITDGNFIRFKIIKKGHLPKEVYIYAENLKSVTVKLSPVKDNEFQEWVLGRYLDKTNKMSRNLLEIQALLINQQFLKAKSKLSSFQSKYPNVSSSYTMFANIYLNEKKFQTAEVYLLRALELDKEDSTARRLLKKIRSIE